MSPKITVNDCQEIVWQYVKKDISDLLKNTRLANYDWGQKEYVTLPKSKGMIEKVRAFAEKHKISLPDSVNEDLPQQFFVKRIQMSQAEFCKEPLKKPLPGLLTDYQKAAVAYAAHTHRCFIADPNPSDRRAEALGALFQLKAFPAILVIRPGERDHWLNEIRRILGNMFVCNFRDVNDRTPKESIWLLEYPEVERGGIMLQQDWKTPYAIVVDDAEMVKSADNQRAQNVYKLAWSCTYCFLLADLPVNLSPVDLRNPLHLLGKGGEFAKIDTFLGSLTNDPAINQTYIYKPHVYKEHLRVLYQTLRSNCLVRRAADPGVHIIDKVEFVELGNLPKGLDSNDIRSDWRRLGLRKADAIMTWIGDFGEKYAGKFLVIAHHQDLIREIQEQVDMPVIYGNQSQATRNQVVTDFIEDPHRCYLVLADDADLPDPMPQVSLIVIAELLITPQKLYRLVDAVRRDEPNKPIQIVYLVSNDYLDVRSLGRLNLRRVDISKLLSNKEDE